MSPITVSRSMERLAFLLSYAVRARFLRFALVGLSGVFVDMTVLYLLHDRRGLNWDITLSKTVAAEFAMVSNFLWNDLWTFGDISRRQKGWPKRLVRLLRFNSVGLIGLGLNVLIVSLLARLLNVHYLLANLVAIATVTAWNFGMNRAFSWRREE